MAGLTRRHFLESVTILSQISGYSTDFLENPVDKSRSEITISTSSSDTVPESFQYEAPSPELDDAHIVSGTGDPIFSGRGGWEFPRTEELATLLHRLHVDAHTSGGGPKVPISFTNVGRNGRQRAFFRERIPSERYGPFSISRDLQPWFEAQHNNGKWPDVDNSFVEDPLVLASEAFDGSLHGFGNVTTPSIFPEPVFDVLSQRMIDVLNLGFTHVFIDHMTTTRGGLDFSSWAQEAFREYLSGLSEDRRSELGIPQSMEFDLRQYIQNNDLESKAWRDEVIREYSIFHYQEIRAFWNRYKKVLDQQVDSDDPSRVDIYGNLTMGDDFTHTPVSSYVSADSTDMVFIEDALSLPPDWIRDVIYKIGLSMGRYQKRVHADGGGPQAVADSIGLDRSMYRPTLLRIRFAEGYANGGMPAIDLTGHRLQPDAAITNWLRPDLSVDDSLWSILDFVWAHEPYLEQVEPNHRVALVFSLPTQLWHERPDWRDVPQRNHPETFRWAAEQLTRSQIPYDVLTFGHSRVWQDQSQLDRLTDYDVVVLPDVESINDMSVTVLESCLDTGTGIVVIGQIPSRTEDFEPRSDLEQILTDELVRHLETNPALADDPDSNEDFTQAVDALHNRQVEVDAQAIGVNVHRQSESRFIVHFVNYDYDHRTDTVNPQEEADVRIRGLPFEPAVVEWHDDDNTETLSHTTDDNQVSFQIPILQEWGFAVIVQTQAALATGGNESRAHERVSAAEAAVSEAKDDGREMQIAQSSAEAHRSRRALEYSFFDRAIHEAEAAISSVDRAHRRPVIGIDQGHNQTGHPSGQWTEFQEFRDAFSDYEIVRIDGWTASILDDIDVLIVPPNLSGDPYGFTDQEIILVKRFVQNGGGLIVDFKGVPWDVAPDLDSLTQQFGFQFDTDPLGHVEGGSAIETTVERTTLTWLFIGEPPPGAVIHGSTGTYSWAKIAKDENAWINREGPQQQRNPDDVDAAGLPVGVVTSSGNGFVVGTSYDILRNAEYPNNQWLLAKNVIDQLGANARYSQRSVCPCGDVTHDGRPARDPDDDGLYEDVNGDGKFSILDVQTFFERHDSGDMQNNSKFFDFADDGGVGIADVQSLFVEFLN